MPPSLITSLFDSVLPWSFKLPTHPRLLLRSELMLSWYEAWHDVLRSKGKEREKEELEDGDLEQHT